MVFGGEGRQKFIAQQIVSYKERIHADDAAADEAVTLASGNFGNGL